MMGTQALVLKEEEVHVSTNLKWFRVWYQLKQSPLTVLGGGMVVLIFFMMLFAPLLSPYPPDAVDLSQRLLAPDISHWFGTDEVGRDILSRVIYGSRQSVSAGLSVVLLAGITGSILGCFSGMMGGKTDMILMRVMDIMLSVPSLVLTMALAAALGPSLFNAMLAIAVVRIPYYVRLARGQTLTLRYQNYLLAAQISGARRWHQIHWHILRNAMPPLLIQASLDIGNAILMAATLGFIGLGAQQPTAEWGAMVANGRNYMLDQWWYCTFPGIAILVTATSFNLIGDGLRDLLDPKSRRNS